MWQSWVCDRREEEGGGGRREATRDTESKTRTPHKVGGKNAGPGFWKMKERALCLQRPLGLAWRKLALVTWCQWKQAMPRKLCWMSLPGLSLTFTPGGYGQTHVESAFPLFLVVIPVSLGYLRLQVLLLPAASLELKPLSSGQNLSVEARGELLRFQTRRVRECRIPTPDFALSRSTAQPLKGSAGGLRSFFGLRKQQKWELSLCAHKYELPFKNFGRNVSWRVDQICVQYRPCYM